MHDQKRGEAGYCERGAKNIIIHGIQKLANYHEKPKTWAINLRFNELVESTDCKM